MDGPKILEVVSVYRNFFQHKGIPKKDHPHCLRPGSAREILSHCHGMLDKIEVFVAQDRIGKAFRWLGFIQGCLWATGHYVLDDLKNHNRPAEDGEGRKE